MIATIVFVYGLIFPSADGSLIAPHTRVLSRNPRSPGHKAEQIDPDPVSQFVWGHFSADDRRL